HMPRRACRPVGLSLRDSQLSTAALPGGHCRRGGSTRSGDNGVPYGRSNSYLAVSELADRILPDRRVLRPTVRRASGRIWSVPMTTVHSPTAGRRRLRNALRRARDAAGLTQEQVAEAMDWSLSKVIRIETGGVGVSTSDLRQLLLLYQIDDPAQVAELVELARVGRQRPWWTRYKDTVPGSYLSYIGLEDESSALRCVNPAGLPGLLQTPDFARALVDATWLTRLDAGKVRAAPPTPQEMAERVEVRIIRQQNILRREHPPQITVVLDEAVLWRQIGGPEVLAQQLLHLVELGR